MKIAIDTSPLTNANAVRGIGFYTKRLIQALQTFAPQHAYHQITDNRQLKTDNFDLIHYPYFDPFFLTLPARKNIPIVVTIHDCILLQFPQFFPKGVKGWLKLQLQTWKLHQVDAIVTDSQYSKQDIQKFYRIPPAKIHVAPLAVEANFQQITELTVLNAVKNKYQLPHQFLLKVGDINPTKNFHLTLQALAQLPNVHLVLVGKALVADKEDKPVIPELRSILQDIEKYQLHDRVHRIGFVPDEEMPTLYSLATATIQNSLYEGFGLPALESIACATPVISANTSSLPEIVGDTGIKINPESVEQTVHAIETIFNLDAAEYRHFSQASLIQSKNFSLEKLAHDTVSVYESIIK